MVYIAILGHGVVGSGVVEVMLHNADNINSRVKEEIFIKHILDLRSFPESPLASRFTTDFENIINDSEIRIVVEVMGGVHPAYDFVKRCLLAGKSVVTSNKELVAVKGAELIRVASENNVNFLFEASVGGGIPILRPLSQCLAANRVSEIAGILNGTTNFILTKMIKEQVSFEDALAEAQSLGYAERDPAADVDGHDACRKICILAALAFGKHVYPEAVYTQGIRSVKLEDVAYAENWGGVIKLIGLVREVENGKLQICVAPMLVSRESQIASVDGVFNGIKVNGDATGEIVFYGRGAGKLPTASAVVADIIDCVKHLSARKYLFWEDCDGSNIESYSKDVTGMYFRFKGDKAKILADAEERFGELKLLSRKGASEDEIAFVTTPHTIEELESFKAEQINQGAELLGSIRLLA
ncbi:MAG: homoserine dehydrogenase [Oscillospiraceae bacterium]|jgi:homoserine dehydrogenase|nr:homoserine dehydrogenase [Oscillospiraceae bacterium]